MKTRTIAVVVGIALLGGAVLGWRLNLRARSVYTDAGKIRTAVAGAPLRSILWQPAERIAADADADQYEPRVSADGNLMVFVRGRAGANADLYQRRRAADGAGGWKAPEAIAAINTASDELGPELSGDGKALYFYSDRAGGQGGYDIWVSRLGSDGWAEPVNLGPGVNSPFNDYGPALGLDGMTLYFSSNRPRPGEVAPQAEGWTATLREQRTRHDYDLYRAGLGADAAAVALTELNTEFDEGAPAMSPAGDFLYFASDRRGGLGGFDVYRSRLLRGVLQAPEGLGPAINSAANDLDPAPSTDGFRLYFSSDRADRTNGADVPADGADSAKPVRYALWSSASREVFVEAEPLKAGEALARLWAAAWPWLLALLMATLLALGFIMAMRDATMRQRLRQLSLMAKCLLVSLLIHALILSGLVVWKVGSAIGDALSSGGGTRAIIGSSGDSGSDGGLSAQVRGAAATMEVNAPTLSTAAPAMSVQEIASATVMITTSPASLSILPPSARLMAEEAASSPQVPEAKAAEVASVSPAMRTPRADAPADAVSESRHDAGALGQVAAAAPAEIHGTVVGSGSVQVAPDGAGKPSLAPLSLKIESDAGLGGGSAPAAQTIAVTPVNSGSAMRIPGVAAGASGSEARASTDAPLVAGGARASVAGVAAGSGSVSITPDAGGSPSVAPLAMRIEGDASEGASTPSPTAVAAGALVKPSASRLPNAGTGVAASEASGAADAPVAGGAPAPVAGTSSSSGTVAIAPAAGGTPSLGKTNVEIPVGEASGDVSSRPAIGVVDLKAPPMAAARMPGTGDGVPKREAAVAEAGASQTAPALGAAAAARPVIAASGSGAGSVSITPGASEVKSPTGVGMNTSLGLGTIDDSSSSAPPKPSLTQGMPRLGLPGARLPAMEKDPPKQPAETFAQRAPEIREKVLEKTGGSKDTERAVTLALEWFKAHQSGDGRWSGVHFDDRCGKCSGEAEIDSDASMTGMALLCFLGAGHTQAADGPYRQTVSRAINWLIQREDSNGDLRRGETMYSQTIAAVALCEAYAMTRDASLEGPARRAVEFVARGPSQRDGRASASDTSVLGWQIMAIKSAQRAGFSVPTTAFDAARRWLDQTAQRGASGRYGYRPGEAPSAAATAEAMFVQQLLGHTRDEGRMVESARFILNTPPAWKREAATHYWYYATLAMFQQQGESWKQWNSALAKELMANQHQEDGLKGSWDPQDQWSRLGGRVYQTAVCTLSLEVYYRYRVADEGRKQD